MKYMWNSFLLALSLQLRSWKTWILFLLLPGVTWMLSAALPAQAIVSPVQVGVCLPEQGAEVFWESLERKSGTVTTFIPAEEETIIGKVSTGQWDCGIVLPQDFSDRVEDMDTDELVQLYIGEASTVYPVVREIVAACLIDVLGEGIAREYLEEESFLKQELRVEPLPMEDRVGIRMSTLDGRELNVLQMSENTSGRVIMGIVAIVLTIWMCLSAVDLGRWLEQPGVVRFAPLRTTTQRLLPQILASALPILCSAGICLCIYTKGIWILMPLLAFLMAMCAWLLVIARSKTIWSAMPVLMPFVPVLCLVLSPIILDFSAMVPAIGFVADWMPLTLYLYGAEGKLQCVLTLLLLALLGAVVSVVLDLAVKSEKKKVF